MGTRRDDPAAAHHCFVSRGRAAHNIDALARHWWRKSLEHRRDHLRSRTNSLVRGDRRGPRHLGGRTDCLACDQAPHAVRARIRGDQLRDQRSARHCRGACSGDDHDTFCSPLYQTVTTVLLAYVMMFLPRALISLRASLAQAPVELEEVARSLGRSPARALWGGTLRLAAPGAAAGAAMVFLGVVNELTATLLLAPNGTETLATSFWALSGKLDYAAAAPYATIMVALSLPLTWLLYRQSRRLAGR